MTTLMLLVPSLWLRDTVGAVQSGLAVNAIVVADSRNDGTNRVYAAADTFQTSAYIGEFTWSGAWSGGVVFVLPYKVEGAFTAGDGRNDGVNRLYAAGGNCTPAGLYELSWTGSAWDTTAHGVSLPASNGNYALALGDGRNDGVNRVYTALRTGLPNSYTVAEWLWDGSAFQSLPVSVGGDSAYGQLPIALGDGRNDGVNRLYHAQYAADGIKTYVYETSRVAGAWSTNVVKHDYQTFSTAIRIGALKPDGLNRIYTDVSIGTNSIYEGTYEGEDVRGHPLFSQSYVTMVGYSGGVNSMAIGLDPCGSGREQLFAIDEAGRVHRVYWGGGAWTREVIDSLGEALATVTVGVGRNDGVPRLYVGGRTGYVYELSCVPQSAEETEPAQPLALRVEAGALRFALPAASAVNLALYDASGRRRATLFSGTLSAGEHAFALPQLPRGVYAAVVETANARANTLFVR